MLIRIIKKYPNRRLYDTKTSSYIVTSDVKKMVLSNEDFKVIDSKTNEDITNQILLQIINEQEQKGTPIFTEEILKNLIRIYGNTAQDVISSFLEKTVLFFIEQQQGFRDQLERSLTANPFTVLQEMTEKNLNWWRQTLTELYQVHDQKQKEDKDDKKE